MNSNALIKHDVIKLEPVDSHDDAFRVEPVFNAAIKSEPIDQNDISDVPKEVVVVKNEPDSDWKPHFESLDTTESSLDGFDHHDLIPTFQILPPECVNQLCALDSSFEAFLEWTLTPDPSAKSICAVLMEGRTWNSELSEDRISSEVENEIGKSMNPCSLIPEARVYICEACGNAYLSCNDLYKHYVVCAEDEEEVISAVDSFAACSDVKAFDDQSQVKKKAPFKIRSSEVEAIEGSEKQIRVPCPCCSTMGAAAVIIRHMLNEICSLKLKCADCTRMLRLHSKTADLHNVHSIAEGNGRCVKSCANCTFAESASLIEYDDHVLTHPLCVICFRMLHTDLGLRRHLMGTHKIDAVELMAQPKKYFGTAALSTLSSTLDGHLLALKRLGLLKVGAPLLPRHVCDICGTSCDSHDALLRHASSLDVCKGCHAAVDLSASAAASARAAAAMTKKPSILKRKPVQTFCAGCRVIENDRKRMKIS